MTLRTLKGVYNPRKQRPEQLEILMEKKVGKVEGAVPLQTMQLSDVTRERDFLLKQVDTLSVKLVNLDGQLNRERTKSSMLQLKVGEFEEELHLKTDKLLQAFSRQNELELEISTVREDQKSALQNTSKLESDLLVNHVALKSAKAELLHFQEISKKLQNSVITTQKELELSRKEVEVEKGNVSTLEVSVQNLTAQLESATNDMTKTHQQLAERDGSINQLKEEFNTLSKSYEETSRALQEQTVDLEVEKSKLKQAFDELETKDKELSAMQVQLERLNCSLTCESERNSTLQIDVSTKEGELKDLQQQCSTLSKELEEFKQQHKEIVEAQTSLISKLKSEILLAQVQNRKSSQEIESLNNSVKEEQEQSSHLQDKIQLSEDALLTMKRELQDKVKELSTMVIDNESLESSLAMSERRNLELYEQATEAQQEASDCKHQLDRLETELSLAKSQLKSTAEQLQVLTDALESEKGEKVQLQVDLKSSKCVVASLQQKIDGLEWSLMTEKDETKNLTADVMQLTTKHEEINKCLHEAQCELFAQQASVKQAQDDYSAMTSTMKERHEEEIISLTNTNDLLNLELKKTRNNIVAIEEQLRLHEEKTSEYNAKLTLMEQKCSQLEKELESKANVCKGLESHNARLDSQNTESKLLLSDLSDKVAIQSSLIEQLKVDLDHSCHERDSLHEQLQFQRETAAASLNRMQKHNQEKCNDLHKKIQEQAGKLNEANDASKTSKKEAADLKAKNHALSLTVCEKEENLSLLREELREETMQLKLSQQKTAHLESTLLVEQENKKVLEESLSAECAKRVEHEALATEREKQLKHTLQELHQHKNFLAKEKTCAEKLRGDMCMLQTKHATTEAQLEATRETLRDCKIKTEKELTNFRQKYHTERRTLKDRVRELHSHLQKIKTQYECRSEEILQLETKNKTITEDQKELSRKFAETEHLLRVKTDECESVQMRVQSLEIQIAQLQKELSTLRKVALEVEDHSKKVEARSRSDVKRVLAEVTEHMEQQYSNQRYLDKLRSDNETLTLLEKERQIGQLKNELKLKKQEVKQDQLYIERLSTQSKHLRKQQKDHESSRRRLECQLDQVNNTLCHTFPLSSTSTLAHRSSHPLLSSTPKRQ